VASKQLILVNPEGGALGTKSEVMDRLARFNTAPDGSEEARGVAFGPGFHVELPWIDDADDLQQAAITVVDQEAAWQVLSRMLRDTGWSLMDLETGQTFGESTD
jgi:hypothetical protein